MTGSSWLKDANILSCGHLIKPTAINKKLFPDKIHYQIHAVML